MLIIIQKALELHVYKPSVLLPVNNSKITPAMFFLGHSSSKWLAPWPCVHDSPNPWHLLAKDQPQLGEGLWEKGVWEWWNKQLEVKLWVLLRQLSWLLYVLLYLKFSRQFSAWDSFLAILKNSLDSCLLQIKSPIFDLYIHSVITPGSLLIILWIRTRYPSSLILKTRHQA